MCKTSKLSSTEFLHPHQTVENFSNARLFGEIMSQIVQHKHLRFSVIYKPLMISECELDRYLRSTKYLLGDVAIVIETKETAIQTNQMFTLLLNEWPSGNNADCHRTSTIEFNLSTFYYRHNFSLKNSLQFSSSSNRRLRKRWGTMNSLTLM